MPTPHLLSGRKSRTPRRSNPGHWGRDLPLHLTQLEDRTTGFRAAVYTDGGGHYTLAFAGSNDIPDWLNNLGQTMRRSISGTARIQNQPRTRRRKTLQTARSCGRSGERLFPINPCPHMLTTSK